LHLGDVVGGAGDQRSGGEFIELGAGEGFNPLEKRLAQVAGKAGGRAGGKVADAHCTNHGNQGNQQHPATGFENIGILELARVHAQGGIFRPGCANGSLIDHAFAEGSKLLFDGGADLGALFSGELAQHRVDIGSVGKHGEVKAKFLAHGSGLGWIGKHLLKARDNQQCLPGF